MGVVACELSTGTVASTRSVRSPSSHSAFTGVTAPGTG
jgi:hypothetical protein